MPKVLNIPDVDDGDDVTKVVAAPFEMFRKWFADVWEPGQHLALPYPTGEGKTTIAVQLLQARKWVLALDPKGGDPTLAASGFVPITAWPPPNKIRDQIAEGKPARLIVTGSVRTDKDMARLRELMHECVSGVRAEGGWTLYCDEFQLLADRRMFGLDKPVEAALISARARGTSVVTSFQATAWVPKAATRQATYVIIGPTRDEDMVKGVARTMGRDWRQLIAAVKELPPYHVLCIPKRVHAPMVLTKAPRIN